MLMAIFDRIYDSGVLENLASMDGLERTYFINDIYNDDKIY